MAMLNNQMVYIYNQLDLINHNNDLLMAHPIRARQNYDCCTGLNIVFMYGKPGWLYVWSMPSTKSNDGYRAIHSHLPEHRQN